MKSDNLYQDKTHAGSDALGWSSGAGTLGIQPGLHAINRALRSEAAFEALRAGGVTPRLAAVLEYVPGPKTILPELNLLTVDLAAYDGLLEKSEVCHE